MEEKSTTSKFLVAQESLVTQQSDFSLRTITEMVDNDVIDVSPHYQRRDRWSAEKQSALLESFILNVPVPPVYLSEDDFGNYSVIDGKQRITAISSYLRNEFKLTQLQKFSELNGKLFSDLPIAIRNALSVRPYIRIVTLLKQSDPNLKYEVFLRLNTGGEKLKPQEIRNVAYSGTLNNLLFDLSDNHFLKKKLKITGKKSPAYRSMDDLEHILRFFTLKENWQNIGQVLSTEMDKYMAENQNAGTARINNLKRAFEEAIRLCESLWGNAAFNKPSGNTWRSQLISPLYDAQMIAASMLTNAQKQRLATKSSSVKQKTKELFQNDPSFVKSVTQATNNPNNVKERISKMHDLLIEATKS